MNHIVSSKGLFGLFVAGFVTGATAVAAAGAWIAVVYTKAKLEKEEEAKAQEPPAEEEPDNT